MTRPVCITRTELECAGGPAQPQQQPFNPALVPTTNFEGTGPVLGLGRSQPLQSSRRDGEDLSSDIQAETNRTMEEFFLSTGVFQRGRGDEIRRPLIVPKRFKKQTNRRQESEDSGSDGSDGSLEEMFLSTGVFQREESDGFRSSNKAGFKKKHIEFLFLNVTIIE